MQLLEKRLYASRELGSQCEKLSGAALRVNLRILGVNIRPLIGSWEVESSRRYSWVFSMALGGGLAFSSHKPRCLRIFFTCPPLPYQPCCFFLSSLIRLSKILKKSFNWPWQAGLLPLVRYMGAPDCVRTPACRATAQAWRTGRHGR